MRLAAQGEVVDNEAGAAGGYLFKERHRKGD
jgi:hypothetical protein